MPDSKTVFEKIIDRDLPAEIIYEDDVCLVIMDIKPVNPGHSLVIPKHKVAEWLDLDTPTINHLTAIAQQLGRIQKELYKPFRVGLAIVGFDVEHAHIHVFPMYEIADINHGSGKDTLPEVIKGEANKLRAEIDIQGGLANK